MTSRKLPDAGAMPSRVRRQGDEDEYDRLEQYEKLADLFDEADDPEEDDEEDGLEENGDGEEE